MDICGGGGGGEVMSVRYEMYPVSLILMSNY